MNELDRLMQMYPSVEILEIGDFYSRDLEEYNKAYAAVVNDVGIDEAEKMLKNMNIEPVTIEKNSKGLYIEQKSKGVYDHENKSIYINHSLGQDKFPMDELIEMRKRTREKAERRKKLGLDKYIMNFVDYNSKTLECVLRHEVGHAIDYTYNLDTNIEMILLYNSLPEEQIKRDLSEYAATSIKEFIAVGFEESFFYDCSALAKKVRSIIDKVVKDAEGLE